MKLSCLSMVVFTLVLTSCPTLKSKKNSDLNQDPAMFTKYNEAQQMITLASLAYDTTLAELTSKLADTSLSTQGNWSLVWGPEDINTTKVFVVKNTSSPTPMYAVSIRGTIDSLTSWFYDFYDLELVQLPWVLVSQKQIGIGLSDAWRNIYHMQSNGVSLVNYLHNAGSNSVVYVTGHSQGGGLATIVASWLYDRLPKSIVKPITFAGQTAGSNLFAEGYNSRFKSNTPQAQDKRYFNTFDIVPMGFSDISKVKDLYPSPGPGCPLSIKGLIDFAEIVFRHEKDHYTQVGTPFPLSYGVLPASNFFKEVGFQHSHLTYQYLLKVPFTENVPLPYPPEHL